MLFLHLFSSPLPVLPIFGTFFTKASSRYACLTPSSSPLFPPSTASSPPPGPRYILPKALSQRKDGDVPESKRKHTTEIPKELLGVPPHREPYLDKMSIPLSRSCWEKGGYSDSYLDAIPGPISRHPLISLKLVGHLINLKLPSQTLWQLAGRSVFCLTCQTTYEKDWIS